METTLYLYSNLNQYSSSIRALTAQALKRWWWVLERRSVWMVQLLILVQYCQALNYICPSAHPGSIVTCQEDANQSALSICPHFTSYPTSS